MPIKPLLFYVTALGIALLSLNACKNEQHLFAEQLAENYQIFYDAIHNEDYQQFISYHQPRAGFNSPKDADFLTDIDYLKNTYVDLSTVEFVSALRKEDWAIYYYKTESDVSGHIKVGSYIFHHVDDKWKVSSETHADIFPEDLELDDLQKQINLSKALQLSQQFIDTHKNRSANTVKKPSFTYGLSILANNITYEIYLEEEYDSWLSSPAPRESTSVSSNRTPADNYLGKQIHIHYQVQDPQKPWDFSAKIVQQDDDATASIDLFEYRFDHKNTTETKGKKSFQYNHLER